MSSLEEKLRRRVEAQQAEERERVDYGAIAVDFGRFTVAVCIVLIVVGLAAVGYYMGYEHVMNIVGITMLFVIAVAGVERVLKKLKL